MCTKLYQNRLAFVEDVTKTFCCVFIGSQCMSISYIKVIGHRGKTLICMSCCRGWSAFDWKIIMFFS